MLKSPKTLDNHSWPPNYIEVFAWKQAKLVELRSKPKLMDGAIDHYRNHERGAQDFINHWCMTYDPRLAATSNKLAFMPFIMFQRQDEFIALLAQAIHEQAPVLCEKSRDMGVTWLACAFSVWLWLFADGPSIGWGSRKAEYVDTLGDPKSVFEKIRMLLRKMPPDFLPEGFDFRKHSSEKKLLNPKTGATITGEGGDSIGRGGRTLMYFLDEAAHVEHPESIEAGISNNTNIPVDISSVNGPATVFQRKRDAGYLWTPGHALHKDASNVFIFDWSEHPEKTQEWYDTEKRRKIDAGMPHIFAQEVDRNPSAAVVGTLIESEWFKAAVGAADKLSMKITGGWGAALDVADADSENADRNALAARHGIQLEYLSEWGERDTGNTTRRAVNEVGELVGKDGGRIVVDYDCIGVGAGVKAEVNRLEDEKLLSRRGIRFTPWNAATKPLDPDGRVIPEDDESILNKDFYANLKAQGWWQLRLRFERTHRALNDPDFTYDPDELISINPELPQLRQLEKELLQVTSSKNPSLKLVVNKTPEGQRSPNLADAVMMVYWPSDQGRPMVVNKDAVRLSRVGGRKQFASAEVFNPAAFVAQATALRGGKAYSGGGMYASRKTSFNDY